MLPLPPAVIGGGELMAMAQAHFGDTDCVAITLVHLPSDVVIATGLSQKRLQLFHRHGQNLQRGSSSVGTAAVYQAIRWDFFDC